MRAAGDPRGGAGYARRPYRRLDRVVHNIGDKCSSEPATDMTA
jgi:hypothetical protein